MIDRNTPMWQLTLGEFLQELRNSTENSISSKNIENFDESKKDDKEYVYGLNGLAKLLGCSVTHASRLKSQGIFDKAISQRGRKIVIDKNKALELFNNKN